MTRDDNPFARWSRRKRASAAGHAAPVPERPEPKAPAPEADDQLPEEEILKKLGLPDPDTLTSGDDFKAFLAREVPEYLRRRALRRLWTTNPVLANVDGLVEYGGDFTDVAVVPDVVQTAYRIGKGFLQPDAEGAEPPVESAQAEPDDPVERGIAEPDAPDIAETPDSAEDAYPTAAEDPPAPPRPRRMTFRTT